MIRVRLLESRASRAAATAALCLAGTTPACDREIVHPTGRNIPRDADLAHVIHASDSSLNDAGLRQLADALTKLREVLRIGGRAGDESKVFGNVRDVAIDGSGIIYILEASLNEVRLFDSSGDYLERFGSPQGALSKFTAPQAIALDGHGRVIVGDFYKNLKVFERQQSGFAVAATYPLPAAPRDLCTIGDVAYVQAFKLDGGSIHALLPSGQVFSFGMQYLADHWLVRHRMSRGPIACVGNANIVLGMLEALPTIYAYSTSGSLLWVSTLRDFLSPVVIEGENQKGHYVRDGSTTFDFARRMVWLGGDYVLLQVARFDSTAVKETREYSRLQTYVLNARSGEGRYVGDGVAEVFAFRSPYVATAARDPFPHVSIFQLGTPTP